MAKKSSKNKKLDTLDTEMLADIVTSVMKKNGISELQLLKAIHDINNGGLSKLCDKMYTYKKPNYAKMTAPLHPALEPLLTLEVYQGVSTTMESSLEKLRGEDAATVKDALVNALYYILANQQKMQDNDSPHFILFAILHMMVELQVKGVTSAVLELLRQDWNFMSYFFDAFEEEMAFAISQICADDLPLLEDFMYEPGLVYTAQCIVADGVTHIAMLTPTKRIAIVAWWARVLKKFAEIKMYDPNIDHFARTLSQLHAKELKPLVEHLYEIKDVPFIENEDLAEVMRLLEKGTDERRVIVESLADVIAQSEKLYVDDDEDYQEDFEDYDEEDDIFADYDFNDEEEEDGDEDYEEKGLLVGKCDDGLLYHLEISIDDCPVNVVREVIVPSNIRLSRLGQVLIGAMGWNGGHLNQFIKGRAYYSENFDDWFGTENYDYSQYALNGLLSRKSSKIKWEYDFGDSWMHTVKLVEKIKNDGSRPLIEVTKAENACPPDDCGGVWGYAHLLEALKDKKHPEHKSWKQWVGPGFNPHKVSLSSLNRLVQIFLNP